MSETMSSVEIEDVLSSIRRLVSEDLRPAPKPPVEAAKAIAVDAIPADPEPKADDKLILTPAFRVVSNPAPQPLPRLHLGVAPVTRIISTLERSVGAQSAEWESEVGDPPLLINDMEWSENGWVAPTTARVVPFAATAPDATPSWAQPDPEIAEPDAPAPITEPDGHWADQAEAAALADLHASSQAEPAEMRLDEQVLRELVRELILAELQGTLGERITRNVRKLVRAEIARAISLHGVE